MGIFKEMQKRGIDRKDFNSDADQHRIGFYKIGFSIADALFIKPSWAKPGDLFIDSEASSSKEYVMDALKRETIVITNRNRDINPTFLDRVNYLSRTHIIPKSYNPSDPEEAVLEFNRGDEIMELLYKKSPQRITFRKLPSIIKNGIKAYKLADGKFACFPVVNGIELRALPTVQYFKELYKSAFMESAQNEVPIVRYPHNGRKAVIYYV